MPELAPDWRVNVNAPYREYCVACGRLSHGVLFCRPCARPRPMWAGVVVTEMLAALRRVREAYNAFEDAPNTGLKLATVMPEVHRAILRAEGRA